MKLINPKSKRAFVNLFSDFIMQKLGKNTKTIIQVTLYNNFIVIFGKTNSEIDLNIEEIKKEFFEYNSDLFKQISLDENIGTLNLIEKNSDYFKINCYRHYLDLYNTERPLYHKNVINFNTPGDYDTLDWKDGIFLEIPHNSILPTDSFKFSPLQITSEFPYGYSLNVGRSLIYYAEYIALNIFPTISMEKFKLLITNQKNTDGDQIIEFKTKSPYRESKIESLILDNFNFDLEKFSEKFDTYDFCDEIKNLSSDKPWLIKDIVAQDLFIF